MVYVDNLEIHLLRANRVYFSGETVKGSLKFQITEPVSLKSINLSVNGNSSCRIKKKGSNNYVEGFEPYLKALIFFLPQNNSLHELDPGLYTYDFEIVLPKSLPSTFKHKIGETSYCLTGCFVKPWSIDRKINQSFTVINSSGFSFNKASLYNFNFEKKDGPCCANSGTIKANFSLDKYSYSIDEVIKFKIKINNESKRSLNGIQFYLIQKIVFKADNINKAIYKRRLASVSDPTQIMSAIEYEFSEAIKIPLVQPSYSSNMIEIGYCLEFVVKTGPLSRNFIGSIDLSISCNAQDQNGNHQVSFDIDNLKSNPFDYMNKLKSFYSFE